MVVPSSVNMTPIKQTIQENKGAIVKKKIQKMSA